ncbi:2-octaprenyl-6-methoxyphenyl hydroxylase [Zobellella maritima]|uniref:2-octaprenyl-6-methoxyphenyl hydroxylase n=1 Tax=Zobellella maritima TaxID=2059725 RepID=UPI000E3024D8|nr:2-octaprenyl-6-methoxyphenyl hydroxylase [Zobellella maritima]
MSQYDVVINGAGMAGAVLALSLARLHRLDGRPLQIAVIEAAPPDLAAHPGFDARSIALAWHSRELLESLGLWSRLAELATPITHIHVSDRGHFGQLQMQAAEYRLPALGYVVELQPVGAVLYQAMSDMANIHLYCPAQIDQLEQQPQQVRLVLSDGRSLSGELLVAADGVQSPVRRRLGLQSERLDYGQSAVIANIETGVMPEGRAFERFTEQGPVALLPMSGGRSSLVWCAHPEHAAAIMQLPDDAFLDRLQQLFGYRLGRLKRVGQRHLYPLALDQLLKPWHHRCVLVGNAAHLLHPIAGQGFNLGLRDVADLVDSIQCALAQGQDIGSYPVLSGYGAKRQADQATTTRLTTGLALMFSNNHWPLVAGRNLGLMAMAGIRSWKDKLAWRAMGKR